jgi:excisionase family DNA binding protein
MESFISFMRYWWPGANMSIITDTPAEISSKESTQIRILRQLVQEGSIKLVGSKGRRAELPFAVVGLLDEILKNMQAGKAVSIVPEHQQLTTQRAANLLGVSRPFLVRLLEEGHLPFHMVGSHRRVYLKDLLAYQKRRDAERHDAINRMARMELEAGTYDKVVLPEGAEER